MLDPSAGLQQRATLVGDQDLGSAAPRLQVRLQLIGEGVDIDHDALDALRLQPVEQMVDQGAAAHLDQRLGPVVGERAHAGAKPRSEHHGGGGRGAAQARCSAGTSRSNHAFRPSRPGAARLRSRWRQVRGMKAV